MPEIKWKASLAKFCAFLRRICVGVYHGFAQIFFTCVPCSAFAKKTAEGKDPRRFTALISFVQCIEHGCHLSCHVLPAAAQGDNRYIVALFQIDLLLVDGHSHIQHPGELYR